MKKDWTRLLAAALLAAPFTTQLSAVATAEENVDTALWPQDASDIAPDPDVVWGVLDNGVRYAILRHGEPPERVSVRLFVDAGSLMEEDDQQGLAHFLEHMAFNGTEHFGAGEMVEYFQRLGMAFGADTNAHTSFNETVYKLELPNAGDDVVKDAFTLLRDYADGMLLDQKEIDEERGIILAEKRDRNSVSYRTFEDAIAFGLPESLIPNRLPIGSADVIQSAQRERFTSFYNTWYTADRMTVVVVGDIDPQRFEALVKQHFASMVPNANPLPDPDLGKIADRGVLARVHREAEAPATSVDISTVSRFDGMPDTTARRARNLARNAANAIIDRRLEILSRNEDAPFVSGSAYTYDWLDFVDNSGIELTCKPGDWPAALKLAEQELRRALEHGFTQAELDEARANTLNAYEEAARQEATLKSQELADALVSSISDEFVFTSPAQDLAIVRPILESLTPEDVHQALRDAWTTDTRIIYVSGNVPEDATADLALETFKESKTVAVDAPEAAEAVEFAYAAIGEPGTIEERSHVDDLDITQLRLANNVYVNLKPTEFEDNVIRILVRFGGGVLEAPADKPGLALLANVAFTAGGLEAHSVDELARIFAGKTVGVDFSVGTDSFTLSGSTNSIDLESELDLMCAYIQAPGYREESLRQARRMVPQLYIQLSNTPEGVMQDKVAAYLADGDFRFGFPAQEDVMLRNLDELKAWLAGPLASSRMEVSIVGDFEVDTVVPLLLKTFGALPERAATKPDYAAARKVTMPAASDDVITFQYTSELPKGVALTVWPTEDQWDIARTRRLGVLADIVDDRLRKKVREELAAAYSPYAYNRSSDTFKDFGFLTALIMIDPKQAEELANVSREIGEDLRQNGTTADELERMVKPMMEQITQWRRNNNYWLGSVLGSSQEFPVRLDWARSMVDDLKSITVDEVNTLAKEYLEPGKAIRISIVPVETAAE